MDITRNQTDCVLCNQRWRSSKQSAKTRSETDCGSDHELLIAKFRLKLKKVGETTRSFRYDLNKTPYVYTVEVMNRSKVLDLIDRVPEELWTEVHNIVQKAVLNAELDESQAGIKTDRRNIKSLRSASDTTLMAKTEEELKHLLMRKKEESEKAGLKLNI